MAVTAYKLPGTAAQVAQGGSGWTNINNVLLNDSNYATDGFLAGVDSFGYKYVRLVKGGSIVGTNIGDNAFAGVGGAGDPATYGGSSQLFGQTLTPADVNDPTFGVAIAWGTTPAGADKTDYIKVTNFGFSVPSTAIINGIELQCSASHYAGGGGTAGLQVNYIQVRVYYTFNNILQAVGEASGMLYSPNNNRKLQDKRFRHMIYDHNDNFIGEHTKLVSSETTYKQDINNLQSSMDVTIQQNEIGSSIATDVLATEADEVISTEDDNDLLIDVVTPAGIGPGTTVEVNNNLEVWSYFGGFVELVTETGEPIITEDDQLMMVEQGYPLGKRIWTGWMSDFDLDFGQTDDITTHYLSHAMELANIMLETSDTAAITASSADSSDIKLVGSTGGVGDPLHAAQIVTPGSTFDMSRFTLTKVRNDYTVNSTVRLSIFLGSNPNSPGAYIGGADTTLIYDPNNYPTIQSLDFVFASPIRLNNGQAYIFKVESIDTFKSGGGGLWPLNIYTATGYSGGDAWQDTSGGSYGNLSPRDMLFTIWQAGGATTVTFNSTDPSQILRSALDFARTRGARANYTAATIPMSGTVVSYTFKANTIDEVFAKVLELQPSDWFGYYDPGDNLVYCLPRPTVPSHYFTRGKDIVTMTITRTIKKMVNDVYFTGGGTPTALFVRTTDNASITQWRRAIDKKSDQRVTDETTATLLSQSDIDQLKNPIHAGSAVIVPVDYAVEDVVLGELDGFMNCGTYIDGLQLQVVSRTYHPDTVDVALSLLLPPVSKRIEDIKRNLNTVEQENLPSSPL
jgi:hypothetical protein